MLAPLTSKNQTTVADSRPLPPRRRHRACHASYVRGCFDHVQSPGPRRRRLGCRQRATRCGDASAPLPTREQLIWWALLGGGGLFSPAARPCCGATRKLSDPQVLALLMDDQFSVPPANAGLWGSTAHARCHMGPQLNQLFRLLLSALGQASPRPKWDRCLSYDPFRNV